MAEVRKRRRGAKTVGAIALGAMLAAAPARGAPRTAYEDRVIEWGMARHSLEPEPNPQGRRIDTVYVARQEIVSELDPYPRLANAVHALTREAVIRREVLLEPGDAYDRARAEETERVLLSLNIFSIARVVPVKGRSPDTVGLLVVTKDLWSLRFNTSYNLVGDLLQFFQFRPTEANLLGRGKRASLDFQLRLDTLSVGQVFVDPRLLGSRLTLTESAAVIFNRDSRETEGSNGSLAFGRPLITLRDRWGYSFSGSWSVGRARRYRGGNIDTVTGPDGTGTIPWIYDYRTWSTAALGTRSFGTYWKTNVGVGLGAYDGRYSVPGVLALDPESEAFFLRTAAPRTEQARYVSGQLRSFRADWRVLRNAESFALSERYQVGHSAYLEGRWSPGLFGGARFVEALASGRYRWVFGNSLTSFVLTATARGWTRERDLALEGTRWVNRRVAAELLEVTPPVGPGRFVLRALLDLKQFDLDRVPLYLGGGNGLRGIVAEALRGQRVVLGNFEYRTLPVELFTVHVGGVLFVDVGTAFDRRPQWATTVGLGLRLLLPQFDVSPARVDYGHALQGPAASGLSSVSSSFGQVTAYGRSFLIDPHD